MFLLIYKVFFQKCWWNLGCKSGSKRTTKLWCYRSLCDGQIQIQSLMRGILPGKRS